jgi:hypothetical protein
MDKSLKFLIGSGIFLVLGNFSILVLFILLDAPKEVAKPDAAIVHAALRSQAVSSTTPFSEAGPRSAVESPRDNVILSQISPKELSVMNADAIEEILARTDSDFPGTVNQLLEALPNLNAEMQAEAAQHIANLSDDALAAQWAQKILSQTLPQPASEVLFNDLLNRPHEMLLPILSRLADMPKHPQSTHSGEILEVLFGQPPIGSNWEKWVKVNATETP